MSFLVHNFGQEKSHLTLDKVEATLIRFTELITENWIFVTEWSKKDLVSYISNETSGDSKVSVVDDAAEDATLQKDIEQVQAHAEIKDQVIRK